MSKLLSRAMVAYEIAEHSFSKIQIDDCYLDSCCYNLQQSIELSLKFLVEMTGQQYAENHDIRANINLLNKVGYHVRCEKDLRNMATTLYSWETESRYKESFVATMEDINDAFKYARELIEEAEEKRS